MNLWKKRIRPDPHFVAGWLPPQQGKWPNHRIFLGGTTAWLRDRGTLGIPVPVPGRRLELIGTLVDHSKEFPTARPFPGLCVRLNGRELGRIWPVRPGPFLWYFPLPPGGVPARAVLSFELQGVAVSNFLAWIGRLLQPFPLPGGLSRRLQEYRLQKRNRQLRLEAIRVDGEEIIHFRQSRLTPARRLVAESWQPGLNLVGFFRAALGVGESVRCAARAADAAGLPVALIDLRLNCLNPLIDDTYAARLQTANPHPVNVFHLDAPQSEEIDHHHGRGFRAGRYNVGYWAWELPEFPDGWVAHHRFFDEIWCPSEFTRAAIAAKVPKPVLAMPHAIDFPVPEGDFRPRFHLPARTFLFLFVYDLNSTQERKNPRAVIAAFRRAFPAGGPVGLVIKTHNPERDPAALAGLAAELGGLPNAHLLSGTLSRTALYELQQACDCFVSLHRAEGFGLNVAECMFLGKPVIATDWSGTAEFVNAANGCPVSHRLVTLAEDHGPYSRGQTWAEPDVDHAVHWMRRLVEDEALRTRLGAQAAADIRRLFSPAAIGRRYRQRLDAFTLW
jgi:glycosyltransferase involved in cell wall biosynthesis